MRTRSLVVSAGLVSVLAVAPFGTGAAAHGATTTDQCAIAQAYSEAGLLTSALERYQDSQASCADREAQLTRVGGEIARAEGIAQSAAKLEDPVQAIAEAQRALQINAENEAAKATLAKLGAGGSNQSVVRQVLALYDAGFVAEAQKLAIEHIKATTTPVTGRRLQRNFDSALRLYRAGYKDEARAEFKALVKQGAAPRQLNGEERAQLDNRTASSISQAFEDAWDGVTSHLSEILFVVVVIALFAIAINAALGRGHRNGYLGTPGKTPRRYQPRCLFAAGVGDGADGMGARLRSEMRLNSPRTSITTSTVEAGAVSDLSAATESDSRLKLLVALGRWFLRRDDLQVVPSLEKPATGSKRYLTLEIWSKGEGGSRTFAIDGAEEPALGQAAVWLLAELSRMRPNTGPRLTPTAGTDSWEAFGAFVAGTRANDVGDLRRARAMFSEAVRQDADYMAARLNRAHMSISDDNPLVVAAGIEELESLISD